MEVDAYRDARNKFALLAPAGSIHSLMKLTDTQSFICGVLDFAKQFFAAANVERPGEVVLAIGILDVIGTYMTADDYGRGISAAGFPDAKYRDELVMPFEAWVADPAAAVGPLIDRMKFSFT